MRCARQRQGRSPCLCVKTAGILALAVASVREPARRLIRSDPWLAEHPEQRGRLDHVLIEAQGTEYLHNRRLHLKSRR